MRLSVLFLSLLLAALAGLSYAEPADTEVDDASRTVEDILTRDPEASDYGDKIDCIQSRRIRSIEVLDDKHVAIKMSRGEYYLIQFEHRCTGLRRNEPVVFEPRGGNRFCVHDALRPTYQGAYGGIIPSTRCGVPGFQSITKEQLVVLKNTLKMERRKPRKSDQVPPSAESSEPQQDS